jgi:hypothetical protein
MKNFSRNNRFWFSVWVLLQVGCGDRTSNGGSNAVFDLLFRKGDDV